MLRLVWLLALAACGSNPKPPPPPLTATAPVVSPAEADERFRVAIRELAKQRGRTIAVWGAAHLDGGTTPYRFAMLDVLVDADGRVTSEHSAHDGAYILEQAPDRYWLITRWWNSAGFHRPKDPPAGEPAWEVLEDRWIEHVQMHNHGKARVSFGFRGGKLVALRDEDDHSRREPEFVSHAYADADGTCHTPCPELATLHPRGAELPVSGPARSIAELVEPPPQS